MSRALAMEFRKIRRRKVGLVVVAMIALQTLWAMWGVRGMDARELAQGWLFMFYQFPLLNAIMMPVVAAVVASRLGDLEHKGQTLKLLHTLLPAGRLFDAKFLCGALYMVCAILAQVSLMLLFGVLAGFQGPPPVSQLLAYAFSTLAVTLMLLALQQALSLKFVNQMVPLTFGLLGGFVGLFILFLPPYLSKLIPWGYYGVLMTVDMNWDSVANVTEFYAVPLDRAGLILLLILFAALYGIGRALFIRKEV